MLRSKRKGKSQRPKSRAGSRCDPTPGRLGRNQSATGLVHDTTRVSWIAQKNRNCDNANRNPQAAVRLRQNSASSKRRTSEGKRGIDKVGGTNKSIIYPRAGSAIHIRGRIAGRTRWKLLGRSCIAKGEGKKVKAQGGLELETKLHNPGSGWMNRSGHRCSGQSSRGGELGQAGQDSGGGRRVAEKK